uniref:hypothetical chloroplast RF19 n=1 Tax=Lantana camara TaxID=126435 RepID=UPI001FA7C07F|nr:hypothetical chloroplast RF19 [Lantana camara]UNB14664.1 hypothetical chloroplast RF19 [Lantana camara]
MIFQSFLLGNLGSLCMRIINSVVVVGLYYGFLTTFSMGPSYLLLLRAQVIEEGTEKKVSETTGFIMGQLVRFISIYYAPLHLALGRPHTITFLALPSLFSQFLWNNHKHFSDYESTPRNSMRNFSIQCVFLNNLIFQLFNHFLFPSSMLVRLVNIYMFRCNNKMLFVTSSFVGWLIGLILFLKWFRLVFVWIRQKQRSFRPRLNKLIRSNKYLFFGADYVYRYIPLRSMEHFFSMLFLVSCAYYLGRMPSPLFTQKPGQAPKMKKKELEAAKEVEEREEGEEGEEREEDEESERRLFFFRRTPLTFLFDTKRWNRPLRYIENDHFTKPVQNEMSQYFFDMCQSDGKERISFTYPPSLSTFLATIKRRVDQTRLQLCSDPYDESLLAEKPDRPKEAFSEDELSSPKEFPSSNELSTTWVSTNKEKGKNINKEFRKRIQAVDKKSSSLNKLRLETRTRLCKKPSRKGYLSKGYDPFFKKSDPRTLDLLSENLSYLRKKILPEDRAIKMDLIHFLFLLWPTKDFMDDNEYGYDNPGSEVFESFKNLFDNQSNPFLKKDFRNVLLQNAEKNTTFRKKLPRWKYQIIDEEEQEIGDSPQVVPEDYGIRSRKGKSYVMTFVDKKRRDLSEEDTFKYEMVFMDFAAGADFRRDLIKGSMRSQRRKMIILKWYQINAHSPLFLDKTKKIPFSRFYYQICDSLELILSQLKLMRKRKIGKSTKEQKKIKKKIPKNKRTKKELEEMRMEMALAWDTLPQGHEIRGSLLLIQCFLRKFVLFPSLITAKNIVRILLLQRPEWSEDFAELKKETYVKCTYAGVPLSETEFPADWFTEGFQIKIVFPFHLRPWHNKNREFSEKKPKEDSAFLTILGGEAQLPFGEARKESFFFKPLVKKFNKTRKEIKKKGLLVIISKTLIGEAQKIEVLAKVIEEGTKWYKKLIVFSEKIIRKIVTIYIKITKVTKKIRKIASSSLSNLKLKLDRFDRLKKVKINESSEIKEEKDSIISNQIIDKSSNQIESPSSINSSVQEKKMKDLIDRISTARKELERVKKARQELSPTITINDQKPQLISKLPPLLKIFKIFIVRIYKNRFLSIIEMTNFDKFFERKQKGTNNNKPNPVRFISTIKKSLDNIRYSQNDIENSEKNIRNRKKNSHILYDLSYVSQAYVFYKLSQIQVSNSYKLRSILQYQEIPPFLKPEIRNSFETQGMVHSKLRAKKLPSSEMNKWKNWLRGHYQYGLSEIRWSSLINIPKKCIPEKWRNKVNWRRIAKNPILRKRHSKKIFKKQHSKKKDQLMDSKNQFKVDSLSNEKEKFQKYSRYDFLSYKFLNYENQRACFFYRSSFQGNKNQEISYKTPKENPLYRLRDLPLNNYLGKFDPRYLYLEKTEDERHSLKFFNWEIFNSDLKSYLRIPTINSPNSYKRVLDWMGMNYWMGMNSIIKKHPKEERLPFPRYRFLSKEYKKETWFIPSELFTSIEQIDEDEVSWEEEELVYQGTTKTIQIRQKEYEQKQIQPIFISQEEIETNVKKAENKKKHKLKHSQLEAMLECFFLVQRECEDFLYERLERNLRLSCIMLRLLDPSKLLLFLRSMQTTTGVTKNIFSRYDARVNLLDSGILSLNPLRLSGKKDGELILYQTLGISFSWSFYKIRQFDQDLFDNMIRRYVFKKMFSIHLRRTLDLFVPETIKSFRHLFDLVVPETILSFRHRRKLRILICFNSKNRNDGDRNPVFWNGKDVKNSRQVSHKNNHLDRAKNQLMKLKLFLWPNYRLEDLACMNRYWFDTNNGSRFSMLRIQMYPRLKVH